MLVQSLPFNSTIGGLANLCATLRNQAGDLSTVRASVSTLTYDLMRAIGLPDDALHLVLTESELASIGHSFEDEETGYLVKCQCCGEEAQELIKYRGTWLLVCEDCANKRG